MKSYVIFYFSYLYLVLDWLATYSARYNTAISSDWLTRCNVIKWHMEIYDAAFPAKRHTRRMDKK